jgi:hypothetical protein
MTVQAAGAGVDILYDWLLCVHQIEDIAVLRVSDSTGLSIQWRRWW